MAVYSAMDLIRRVRTPNATARPATQQKQSFGYAGDLSGTIGQYVSSVARSAGGASSQQKAQLGYDAAQISTQTSDTNPSTTVTPPATQSKPAQVGSGAPPAPDIYIQQFQDALAAYPPPVVRNAPILARPSNGLHPGQGILQPALGLQWVATVPLT
jgi:hypothetical protein